MPTGGVGRFPKRFMDEQICRQCYFRRFFAGKCADFAMLFTDWPALFADLRTGFTESSCSKPSTFSLGTLKILAVSETEGNGVVMMAFGTSVSFMLQQFQTHLLHREIASYCWAGGYEFGMGVVTRLPGS
jgi:hypothetical protein